MRKNLAFFLLLLPLWVLAQTEEAIKYEIISQVLNKLVPNLDCDYYNFEKPIDPANYKPLQPDSIYLLFDPETYDEYKISGATYDSIYHQKLPGLIMKYQQELQLWRVREELGKKVIFLNVIEKNRLEQLGKIKNKFVGYENLLPRFKHSKIKKWDISKIMNTTEYLLEAFKKEKLTHYKYAYAAIIKFSDAILNKERTKAIVQFGVRYKVRGYKGDVGATGFGKLLFLEKKDANWEIDKSSWLWEE